MSVVEDVVKMVRDYETQVGYKPTTLKVSKTKWAELQEELKGLLLYEVDVKDKNKRMFMGMNIIVEDDECTGD